MTAKKANPQKAGRKPTYKKEYDQIARNYCILGAIDIDLAEFFGVTERTIYLWKKKYPSFLEATKEAKDQVDARVVNALFHKAIGFQTNKGQVPPDTTACIFWLKNRQPDKWSDKQEVDHKGEMVHKIERIIIDPAKN